MNKTNKKQRQELLNKEGWIYTNFELNIKDQPVTSEQVKEAFATNQANGFNSKKHDFYFIESKKAYCYKACGEYYTLRKGETS